MVQRELIGIDFAVALTDYLREIKARKIFLVTGKKSYDATGASDRIRDLLERYEVFQYSDFSVNPNFEDIKVGINCLQKFAPDVVIAIGGGSVIDMAKSINSLSFQSEKVDKYIKGELPIINPGKPLVAIPTTSGSGSEATHFAVVYIENKKYSLAHPFILPKISIVDPTLTHSLSSYQAAVTGMDAICQAIESFWSINATPESKQFSVEALKLLWGNIIPSSKKGLFESRKAMAVGAHFAGKAINITKTTAAHAMSYPLTTLFQIPHGHAVALTMPELIRYNGNIVDMKELYSVMGAENEFLASEAIGSCMESLGLARQLHDFNIKVEDIPRLVAAVSSESR